MLAMGDGVAWAQGGYTGGAFGSFLGLLNERLDITFSRLPDVRTYLVNLPSLFDTRSVLLLVGIVAAGLAAEWVVRQFLLRLRHRIFGQHAESSPMRAILHAMLLDAVALLALWVAARFVVSLAGDPQSVNGKIAHQLLLALIYWRGFNFIFRAWLRPNTPAGRIAPVDDATAARLLLALNALIFLPMVARNILPFMQVTSASPATIAAAGVLYVPVIAAGLTYFVWHWRHEMAAWLMGLVRDKAVFHALKIAAARDWWVGGLAFYLFAGLAAFYASLTEHVGTVRGLSLIESMLILLLLAETLIVRLTRHLPMEVPTVGDVMAGCVRLALRLWVAVVALEAVMVGALGAMTAEQWQPHDRGIKVAALSALAFYVAWRFLKYRMDRYIADNPLPAAGVIGEADDDVPAAASRLRTLMPVLRIIAGVTILIVGGLLVLSEAGINVTPLIAGASVLGLAISFGSQSLVRDIVSGMFFLAEDSFRVGEYLDSGRVKGTVESFSVRSIRLRHQNGQLHIVPFGQMGHITNFSRDWTTVKFNLSFDATTDVELLRKTVKKIGLDMMTEPAYAKELILPLKMQGIVDIKDAALIVRFKFTAKPKNPSLIQRIAIRRMYEAFPGKGIYFAKPPFFPGLPATPPAVPPPT